MDMKKINNIVWLFFISLFFVACFEDDNKYDYAELDGVTIEGIAEKYTKVSRQDVLSITPTVTSKADLEYVWELWTSARQDGIIYHPDTIGYAKDLNYEICEEPGSYYLVLNVKNKETGVTTIFRSTLNVVTINSTGWYLLKDEGSTEKYTDYDFIYDGGRIDNWIAFYNDGKKLKGEAVKSIFISKYSDVASGGGYNYASVLLPLAKEEIVVLDLSSGNIRKPFESLFFESLDVKNFQDISVQNDGVSMNLVNNNSVYSMNATNATSFFALYGQYSFSKSLNGLQGPNYFDNLSKSFVYVAYQRINRYVDASTAPISCNDMEADMLWESAINFQAQSRGWISYALMKKHSTSDYMLVKLNLSTGWGNSNPIVKVDIIPSTLNFVTAEKRAVNADYGIIYFVKDHKLYKYLIDNQHEEAILDLPAGEEVTCMQHIAYPNQMSSDVYGAQVNCFAIATYADGKYKVWLHEFDAGNLKPLTKPTFEGNGRVACINYVENNTSNFLY